MFAIYLGYFKEDYLNTYQIGFRHSDYSHETPFAQFLREEPGSIVVKLFNVDLKILKSTAFDQYLNNIKNEILNHFFIF